MRPIRSMLFVPACKPNWFEKIPSYGSDTVILDLEGLRTAADFNRRLGFAGEMIIHPSHVAIINEAYTPSEEQIVYYKGMIEAFEKALENGEAAVIYEGEHIDYAHVHTAKEIIRFAESLKKSQ